MRELLIHMMDETLGRCSLEAPGESKLFEGPVISKEIEENVVLDLSCKETGSHISGESLLEKKKTIIKNAQELDLSFRNVDNESYKCKRDCVINNESNSPTHFPYGLQKNIGFTLNGYTSSPINNNEIGKATHELCSGKITLPNSDSVSRRNWCANEILTSKDQNERECNDKECETNFKNVLRYSENLDIAPLDLKYCQVTSVDKHTGKECEVQIENKIVVASNELDVKCEGKAEGMENSSGYLSQCISNSVAEGGAEQTTDVSESCLKNNKEPLCSYGDGKNDQNMLKKNSTSKTQEAERTQNHIHYLLKHLPDLAKYFDLHKKIGVGTFSSVFLGSLKKDVAHRFPKLKDRKFAIKHLVPTLLPKRIATELKYLHEIGGKDNVISVDLSLRNGDCVVFIMPYVSHKRFSEYVMDMDVEEARDYMRNLMIALRRVHSFNVIHRDVKPSNFLYNRELKRYLLVDFGLSQNVHPQAKWTADEKAKKRKRQEENCCTENMKRLSHTPSRPSATDSKTKRMALQPRSGEENSVQGYNCISQTLKRPRLSDPYGRAQKMIDHLYQQKGALSENKRSPLTSKMSNQQNSSATQNFKLPYSSPKVVEKEMNIRKNLFTTCNEKEQPNEVHSVALEVVSPVKTPLQRNAHQHAMTSKSPLMQCSNKNTCIATPHGSTQQNESSKQKFQTLVPKPSTDGNSSGSTIVRVQNSQVKSQMLKPLSPLESEQQRKLLLNKQRSKRLLQSLNESKCFCKGLPQICNICLKQRSIPAPRAGTPGYRPPEVLLKYPMQTTAVDMWAAGVIMLCILSGCYPFFRSPDDITGLAEIMTVFGTESIKQIAKSLGRTVQCSHDKPPLDLRKLCERLRRRRRERANGIPDTTNTLSICPKCENTIEMKYGGCLCLNPDVTSSNIAEFPPSAYDLLQKLLDLNPVTRISAEEALQHSFLTGE